MREDLKGVCMSKIEVFQQHYIDMIETGKINDPDLRKTLEICYEYMMEAARSNRVLNQKIDKLLEVAGV